MNKKRIITSITALLIATNTFAFSTYASDKDLYFIQILIGCIRICMKYKMVKM